jgi:cyclic-di-AMP phosphodiesterase PgpH
VEKGKRNSVLPWLFDGRQNGGTLRTVWPQALLALGLFCLATLLLLPSVLFTTTQLQIGDLVRGDIRAPMTLELRDTEAIKQKQRKAVEAVPPVYDLDLQKIEEQEAKIALAFSEARRAPPGETALKLFQGKSGLDLTPSTLETLQRSGFDPKLEAAVQGILRSVMERGIVLQKDSALLDLSGLPGRPERGVLISVVGERKESLVTNPQAILDLQQAQPVIESHARKTYPDQHAKQLAVGELVKKLLTPNLTFNSSETQARKQASLAGIKPLFYKIRKGELILRAGDRVTPEQHFILQEIAQQQKRTVTFQRIVGLFLLVAAILGIFILDLRRYRPAFLTDLSQALLLAVLISVTIVIIEFSHFLFGAFVDRFTGLDPATITYALPLAAGAMLTTLLVDVHIALVFSFIASLLIGFLFPEQPYIVLYSFIGSVVASFSVIYCKRRTQLLRAGFFVGLTNLGVVAAINLYAAHAFSTRGIVDLLFGVSGGFLAAVVVSGLLPLFESVFQVTTDFKLLELLDLNQPLLRELFLTAPGTYHHSLMVSNLAETAAEAIGTSPLLARVCCYYHDIGKMVKPEYFIENQTGPVNRHDQLTPNMSSLVILSHVKEGVELAKAHRLPKVILDIIPQHHGTRLIKFFYEKARKEQDPTRPPLKEAEFRYPGPKPQTKTAGIVMLSDAVESASRLLTKPSPARISSLVNRIVAGIFLDGQLDESELTLRDLKKIEEAFIKCLTGIFHHRIEYPGTGLIGYGEVADEGVGKESTTADSNPDPESLRLSHKDPAGPGMSQG